MSKLPRPHARNKTQRSRRQLRIEAVLQLEERQLLAPFVSTEIRTAAFTAVSTTQPTPESVEIAGNVVVSRAESPVSAQPYTSVALLTDSSTFGGDIVRIEAGPGGDFGKGVYAISRGAGGNDGAIDRPGVIYRIDPVTGKASVFFDLNAVYNLAGKDASNSLGPQTGLENWYDLTFDPEGYFDGKTSMFVSSVDATDPMKNVIFRIGPDGSLLGVYIAFSEGAGAGAFATSPSAVFVPPVEQQRLLRGLIVGDGSGNPGTIPPTGFLGLFFDANAFRPGTDLNSPTLPRGVELTGLTFGPQVGLTQANIDYLSEAYAVFTDFGAPPGPFGLAQPGLSGVQGLSGDLLIGTGNIVGSIIGTTAATPDTAGAILSPFRRFQDTAFDDFGYFSYGTTVEEQAGALPTIGLPTYAGSLFVADLATGLGSSTSIATQFPAIGTVSFPVLTDTGPQTVTVAVDAANNDAQISDISFAPGFGLGGRIVRITPDGVVTNFAENFNVSTDFTAESFLDSSLSITFSADGTTLYAADNDGIWQFKSTLSLAHSTSGTITGLSDLRSMGVPYQGQDSAIAILDTGVDALSPAFRGRVSEGYNVFTQGRADDDLAAGNGHGTQVASVVAQFVPEATLVPVSVTDPNSPIIGTDSQRLWRGMDYLHKHPLVSDPVRFNKLDRIIATVSGIGTIETYETEQIAFRRFPQVTLALKGQASKLRRAGNQMFAAAGQFGVPTGSEDPVPSDVIGDVKGMSLPAALNEVLSVTGTYSFPFDLDAVSLPHDPAIGALPRPIGPATLIGDTLNATFGEELLGQAGIVGAGDFVIYADKLLAAANRSYTTDYAAPAVNVPVWRRTFAGDNLEHNVFTEAGTSLSAGMATGSYAVVASAIDYWTDLAHASESATVDAYLTTPVGANQIVFGTHSLVDLSAYATPDGINSILQWTAVPALDQPNFVDEVLPQPLFGSEDYAQIARVDVGNAIAAIEGTIALNYLFAHGAFDMIDTNKNGLITASEIQAFVDQSNTIGRPELGAMARLLGGTDTIPLTQVQVTSLGERPESPEVLQRRFNFFDYAADGQRDGAISIDQLNLLAHKLLPSPDAFTVTDRQRASASGFLVSPKPQRNYRSLMKLLPTYTFVPRGIARRYENISPGRFHVGRRQPLNTVTPFFTLFAPPGAGSAADAPEKNGSTSGSGGPTTPDPKGPTTGGSTTPDTKTSNQGGSTTADPKGPSTGSSTPTTGSSTTSGGTGTSGSTTGNQAPVVSPGNSGSGTETKTHQQKVMDQIGSIFASNGGTMGGVTTPGTPMPAESAGGTTLAAPPQASGNGAETTSATTTTTDPVATTSSQDQAAETSDDAASLAATTSSQGQAEDTLTPRERRQQAIDDRKERLKDPKVRQYILDQQDEVKMGPLDWINPFKVAKKLSKDVF